MKAIFLVVALILSASAQAQTSKILVNTESSTPYTLEPSISFSSINDGSQFVSVAFTGRVLSWLRLGAELDLPANFDEKAQLYQARLLGRVMLLDRKDKVYVQGAGTYSVYNYTVASINEAFSLGSTSTTDSFFTVEAMAGYTRVLSPQWSVGGRLGMQYSQYSPALAAAQLDWSGHFFYNRASIYGHYIF